jgi:hypothetical protein
MHLRKANPTEPRRDNTVFRTQRQTSGERKANPTCRTNHVLDTLIRGVLDNPVPMDNVLAYHPPSKLVNLHCNYNNME